MSKITFTRFDRISPSRSRDPRWILLIGGFSSSTEHLNAAGTFYIGWPPTPRGDMKSLAFKILPPRPIQTTAFALPFARYYCAILSPDGTKGRSLLYRARRFSNGSFRHSQVNVPIFHAKYIPGNHDWQVYETFRRNDLIISKFDRYSGR